jgi:hypothetical protein
MQFFPNWQILICSYRCINFSVNACRLTQRKIVSLKTKHCLGRVYNVVDFCWICHVIFQKDTPISRTDDGCSLSVLECTCVLCNDWPECSAPTGTRASSLIAIGRGNWPVHLSRKTPVSCYNRRSDSNVYNSQHRLNLGTHIIGMYKAATIWARLDWVPKCWADTQLFSVKYLRQT